MTPFSRVSLVAGLAAFSVVSFAQTETPPVMKLRLDRPIVSASKPFTAVLSITFAAGLHGYQNPPSDPTLIPVTVKMSDKTFTLISVAYPKGTPSKVAGESKPVNVYTGTIKIPVTLKAPAKTGSFSIKLDVGIQQCNETSCFPPATLTAKSTVIIASKVGKTLPPPVKAPHVGG